MARLPDFISFTGIDDRTDLHRADELATMYPIEWGVLRCDRSGESRFPSNQAIDEIMEIAGPKSCHLCGKFSKQFQQGVENPNHHLERFDRIQVNGFNVDTSLFTKKAEQYDVEIIIQWRTLNFGDNDFNIHVPLYDMSGGQGKLPIALPPTLTGSKMVGLAGGIGPATIDDFLNLIQGNGAYWLDMESQLRTNGWLDLDKVEYICERVYS